MAKYQIFTDSSCDLCTETRKAKIGDKYYDEYGFFFDLKQLDNKNSF